VYIFNKKDTEDINFKEIITYIEKIINDKIMFEPLDGNTECILINLLTEFFDKMDMKPIYIETSLNYGTKFIDTFIKFPDRKTVEFLLGYSIFREDLKDW